MEESLIKKVQPHSQEAERAVIGSMLMDQEALGSVMEIITKEDFYDTANGILFEVMMELYNEAKPNDLVLIQEKLREKDVPPQMLEMEFMRGFLDSVATSVNVKNYARIVYEKSVLRKLIKINEEIAGSCYLGREPLEDILADTESRIFKLLEGRGSKEFVPIDQVALSVLDKIERASRTKETVTGIPTGFIDLDYKTSGLQPSDLVLIAARPSMGKTAFVLNLVQHIALRKQITCIFFSLEMSKEQLVNRLISMETGINSQSLRTGDLKDSDWETLVSGVVSVGDAKLVIDDTPGISVTELRSKCRKLKLERGRSVVIIDYLQLMTSGRKGIESRQQEISDISRSLKALAREMDAPVIALSQLSRAPEQRPDHRPMLSDLRESGAIEQDADIVMFLYRDDYYNKETEHPNEAEVIIAKQRNGPIGTVTLLWKPDITKFVNIER